MKNKIYYPALFLALLTVLFLAANSRAEAQESKVEVLRRQDGVQLTVREENENNLKVLFETPRKLWRLRDRPPEPASV